MASVSPVLRPDDALVEVEVHGLVHRAQLRIHRLGRFPVALFDLHARLLVLAIAEHLGLVAAHALLAAAKAGERKAADEQSQKRRLEQVQHSRTPSTEL